MSNGGVGFNNPIVSNKGWLIKQQIQSPNYVPNVSGWTINKDGSAQFNDLTVTGGTTQQGIDLFYNGTPSNGNLVMSITANAGTDSYGNGYQSGVTVYDQFGDYIQETFGSNVGWTVYLSPLTHTGFINVNVIGGGSNEQGQMNFSPPTTSPYGAPVVTLVSQSGGLLHPGYIAFQNSDEIRTEPSNTVNVKFTYTNGSTTFTEMTFTPSGVTGVGLWTAPQPGLSLPPVAEVWHPITSFGANWSDANASNAAFAPLGYRLMTDGTVVFRGGFKCSAAFVLGAVMGNLPTGYLPSANTYMPVFVFTGGSAYTVQVAQVQASGAIGINAAGTANSVVDLSGFRYPII